MFIKTSEKQSFEKLKLAGEMRSGPLAFGQEVEFSKTGMGVRVKLLRPWLTFALYRLKQWWTDVSHPDSLNAHAVALGVLLS